MDALANVFGRAVATLSATLIYDRLAAVCLADAALRPVVGAGMQKALRRWLRESHRRPDEAISARAAG